MMSSKRLVSFCALLLATNILFLALFIKFGSLDRHYITIDAANHPDIMTPDHFLSVGVDASELDHFTGMLSNKKLRELVRPLSPAIIRLGGTMSERLIFTSEMTNVTITCTSCYQSSSNTCNLVNQLCQKKFLPFFIMNAKQWAQLCRFAENLNLRLLFSFNVLWRNGDKWDDTNARELLDYSNFVKCRRVDWQLGNEPNSFPHTFNVSIPPQHLAKDFEHLRKLLNEYGYEKSLLVGPDTTRPQPGRPSCLQYMVQFLGNVTRGNDVRSWHQYYLNGRTAKVEDFWAPETMLLLENQLQTMRNHTLKYEHVPMWLSETSSAYGGGAPGLSDSYSSSPLWLDKLGLSALHNVRTVVRQSLVGGNYSLIDAHMNPLPDWWLSVLYKKFVGNRVLQLHSKSSKFQRFYAHCAKRNYTSDKSAIALFGMNLQLGKLKFLLNGTAFDNPKLVIEEYIIGAPSNNRMSKVLLLNGMRLVYNSKMPNFKPRILENGPHITIPPYSIGFWIIKNTSLKVCND